MGWVQNIAATLDSLLKAEPNGSRSRFCRLPGTESQLQEQLENAGLDPEKIAITYGGVMRDMERVCSICAQKRRCERDLAAGQNEAVKSYCRNASTIEALSGF